MALRTFSKIMTMAVLLLAKMSFAGTACPECQTFDFGKRMELKLLEPLYAMNIPQKISYIRSFGVEIFKVADPDKLPPTLASLPLASPAQFAEKYLQLFREGAVGLYMTPNNSMYGVHQPTILFVDSADDWTLVHEFAHYLFDRARMKTDAVTEGRLANNSADAQEDFFAAREKFRNNDGYVSEKHKSETVTSFINYAQVQMVFAETCEFEEVTIEKLLRSVFTTRKPRGFLPEHFARSTRYIRSTSAQGQGNLNFLLQDCESLSKTLNKNDTALKAALTKTCQEAQSLKQASIDLLKALNIQPSP